MFATTWIPLLAENTEFIETAIAGSGSSLITGLTVFVLAVFVGFEIITKIPPTLHTPLMSGSNAISGITVVGAVLAAGAEQNDFATFLGFLAVALAMVNVVGGFLVTNRMLQKFRR
ncbi:MAG: NAD(P) transhydrogenase subunit alpha [Planctomycetaceae bacterium]|nr:NAD(P) transhydrogenase subunit alpha [Planctomycetaceae bacterium]